MVSEKDIKCPTMDKESGRPQISDYWTKKDIAHNFLEGLDLWFFKN